MLHRNMRWLWLLGLWVCLVSCGPLPTLPIPPDHVTLVADGQTRVLETRSQTVGAILSEAQVTLQELDRLSLPETAAIRDGMTITITRVVQSTAVVSETVPFKRQTVRDATTPSGESRLLQAGRVGVLNHVYRITIEDGVQVERVLIRSTLAQPPQDEVLLIGARSQVLTTPISGTIIYLQNQDAWIMRESNRSRRRLTSSGDLDGRVFALAPDGTRLLFTRAGASDAATDGRQINTLWWIETVAADATPQPLALANLLWADWSPDGERLAWSTAEVMERAPGWRGQNDLWVGRFDARGAVTSKQPIVAPEAGGGYGWWGTRYAWSPDGTRLAFSTPESVGVITWSQKSRVTLATFPAYRTYSSWAWNPAVDWSADGRFLVSVLHGAPPRGMNPEESPVFDLWLLEAGGAYSVPVASEVGMWSTPRFSADGEQVLYGRATAPYQSETTTYRLCLMDRDASGPHCVYPADAAALVESRIVLPEWRWTPGAAQLVFIQGGDLYVYDRATGAAAPLTDEGEIRLFVWR